MKRNIHSKQNVICSQMVSGKHHIELSKLKKADVYPPGKFNNPYNIDNIIVLPSGTHQRLEKNQLHNYYRTSAMIVLDI